LNRITKIALSIPSIIGSIFLISLFLPDLKKWTERYLEIEIQGIIIITLVAIQVTILIFRIWSFKNIEKNKKGENTYYLIGLNFISALSYIWKTDDYFIKLNKKNSKN
jgi:hypothetical protein|tara:strand:- start:22240 stop:22563 length:324 start_codon:yes stop_codon:yes gene_type:complete